MSPANSSACWHAPNSAAAKARGLTFTADARAVANAVARSVSPQVQPRVSWPVADETSPQAFADAGAVLTALTRQHPQSRDNWTMPASPNDAAAAYHLALSFKPDRSQRPAVADGGDEHRTSRSADGTDACLAGRSLESGGSLGRRPARSRGCRARRTCTRSRRLRRLLATLGIEADTADFRKLLAELRTTKQLCWLGTCVNAVALNHPRFGSLTAGWYRPDADAQAARLAARRPLWLPGQTLRLAFLGGTPAQQGSVLAAVRDWLQHAHLQVVHLATKHSQSAKAEWRVAFDPNQGDWAYCGADALSILPREPTINIGYLGKDGATDAAERGGLLRLIGHALGLINEHQNPDAHIAWNKPAVYADLMKRNAWRKADVDLNIFTSARRKSYRAFDPQSVMLYRFDGDWLADGKSIGGATSLSASDKRFIAELYPRPSAQPAEPMPQDKPLARRRAQNKK